jgi:tetratricopeptide (TPR) repeat protein
MAGRIASFALLLFVLVTPATAQHNTFVEALVELTDALPGTYGDEGTAIRTALDRLQRGLAEWDQTLREYEANVAAIRPTAAESRVLEMHRTMGLFYLARGRHADAIAEFDAAVARSPEPLFHLFRGLALEGARRQAEALKAFATASTLDPSDPIAAYMLADASVRSGVTTPPPAALATLIGVADRIADGKYAAERDPFLALGVLPDDSTDTPLFVPASFAAAYAQVERGDYARALEMMRAAAATDPLLAPPSPAFARGSAALRAGDVQAALEHFTAAIAEAPVSEAHRMLGVAYWLSAEPERSLEQLEQAVRRDATNERARLMLARVLDEIGETARAEQTLEETVAAIPSSGMAHLRLGRLHAAASRTEDAVREYEAAAGIGALAGEAPLMIDIGELHRREFDAVKAEAAFARAVALRPNDATAHRERGRALLQMEHPGAALVELAAALLIDADDYLSYVTIGQIHLDAGRHAQAAGALTRAIAIDAEKPEAYYTLASVLSRAGRGDEAKAHLATFARLQEQSLNDQRRRIELSTSRLQAGVLIEQGAFEDAVKAWTKILADWGEVAAHHAGLAKALAGLGQVETAVAHYEKALALNADATVYRETAAFYDRLGRTADAARTRARLARTRQAAFAGAPAPAR